MKTAAELEQELIRLKLAFGEFANATGTAEGVWFVARGSETEKLAEECERFYLDYLKLLK